MAAKMRNDITKEILTDLRLNCATVMTKKLDFEKLTFEDLYCTLVSMSGVIYRKTLRSGQKWIVISKEVAKKFPQLCVLNEFTPEKIDAIDRFTYLGTVCSAWKTFVEPSFPNRKILCGASTCDGHCPAYVYCPYVVASQGKPELDEEFNTKRPLLLRYGKKMFSTRYFGLIEYKEESPEQ